MNVDAPFPRGRTPLLRPSLLWLIPILLVALYLRVYDLGHTPLGAHYDEAANAILADEIVHGARPLFIRADTGKEVGYFYLAAAMIRLVGQPLIGIRLASAFIGVLSIALSYRLVRELFGDERLGMPVGLLTAALQAGNLWAISVSRLGFRALLQPALQAVTLIYLYRGLREKGKRPWLNWVCAGVWCGLAAYSYLAIRAFPILLGLFFLWVIVFLPARGGRQAGAAIHPRQAQGGLRNPGFGLWARGDRVGQLAGYRPIRRGIRGPAFSTLRSCERSTGPD